jgi:hypothetical protein
MDTKEITRRKFMAGTAAAMGTLAGPTRFGQNVPRASSRNVLHIIGYSHVDAAWLWPWRDRSNLVLTTARSALDRINETPDFRYCHSSSMHYRWIQESDPSMVQEILRRIREGRWEVVGGWPVEPDCNIPATESFARHALYGKAYCKQALGVDVIIVSIRIPSATRRLAYPDETIGLPVLRLHAASGPVAGPQQEVASALLVAGAGWLAGADAADPWFVRQLRCAHPNHRGR